MGYKCGDRGFLLWMIVLTVMEHSISRKRMFGDDNKMAKKFSETLDTANTVSS